MAPCVGQCAIVFIITTSFFLALEYQTVVLKPSSNTTVTSKTTTNNVGETTKTATSSTTETTSTTSEPSSTTTATTETFTTKAKTELESVTTSTTRKTLSTSTTSSSPSTTLSTTTTIGTTSTTDLKITVIIPEPEISTVTTSTTSTTSSAITSSTEIPHEDHGNKPQGDQAKCQPLVKADVIFGLQAIGGSDRENVADFIKAMGGVLDLKSGSFKLGLKENCKKNVLHPTEFVYLDDYSYAVSDVMETAIAPILFHTRRAFNLSKRRADRVAILLISGKVQDMHRVRRLVANMKRNTKMIVIGVGNFFETEQLQALASYRDRTVPDISHVFPVGDSANLLHIVKKVNKLLCK